MIFCFVEVINLKATIVDSIPGVVSTYVLQKFSCCDILSTFLTREIYD
jgi:hypothetical protein